MGQRKRGRELAREARKRGRKKNERRKNAKHRAKDPKATCTEGEEAENEGAEWKKCRRQVEGTGA